MRKKAIVNERATNNLDCHSESIITYPQKGLKVGLNEQLYSSQVNIDLQEEANLRMVRTGKAIIFKKQFKDIMLY